MIIRWLQRFGGWLKLHRRAVLLFSGVAVVLLIAAQFAYPSSRLLPFASIDGLGFGGWSKTDVIKALDGRYQQAPIALYFGASETPYRTPRPGDIGIQADNAARINDTNYPWYMRLIPGSIAWSQWIFQASPLPDYSRDKSTLDGYIAKELGESCNVLPTDATLKVVDGKIKLEKSAPGGTCELADVVKLLSAVNPTIATKTTVNVPVEVVPADVDDTEAQNLADKIEQHITSGINVAAGSEQILIPRDQLIGWLDFKVENAQLDYAFNVERASEYLNKTFADKVAVAAGVTKVSTYDFVETSRQNGASGRALDAAATLSNLKSYINDPEVKPVVATAAVAPTIQYSRSYSPTDVGLSALMKNFAETHPGTYGVSLIELSGRYRRAAYNSTKSFTTASTYKLFVAYSTLKRVESGAWHWTDQIHGGRDLAKCFDDMIVVSDNECAHALLVKIGFTAITNEAKEIGCTSTSFLGSDAIKTTPADLALILAQLQTGQILSQQSSRDRWIDAMKRNIYRQGIPKGVANYVVADKVGFLDGLLHDAGIVYTSSGPYVLAIMTDGSSWANIAELTRQIEALRLQ